MDLAYLSGYYRIGDYSAVSSSLRYFSLGEVTTGGSTDGSAAMTIKPYELSFDVAILANAERKILIRRCCTLDIFRPYL